jgi:2-iminoacetate synthase
MPVSLMAAAARALRADFPYLAVEVYPLAEAGYRELAAAGVHGVTLYQETYDREIYAGLHPVGPKRDFDARLEAIARAARAGMYVLGIGALLGLRDWRGEAAALALHGMWLRKHFWRCRLQFSFPRITPVPGYTPPSPVGEDELERLMLAFRCYFPEADIPVSTRESAAFRDRAVRDCASHLSAASRVSPGAYAAGDGEAQAAIGQFSLHDTRGIGELRRDLATLNLQPVWKDWDAAIGT